MLDLSRAPLFGMPQPPQGYFAPGDDPLEQALAAQSSRALVGEFEKPRFFALQRDASARTAARGTQGCTLHRRLLDAARSSADGDHVRVEPHLCMGCGGCATVCPSGAMTYAYPRVPDIGARLKTLLADLPRSRRRGRLHPVPRRRRRARRCCARLGDARARACRRA